MNDLVGKKFNSFNVLGEATKNGNHRMWFVKCDCGHEQQIRHSHLISGQKSCKECAKNRHLKHGMSHTKEYNTWKGMKARCYKEDGHAFNSYGGRGIRVCDRWLESFENFFNDMGFAPSPKHSLDRFPNNNGNYEPSNCRWATDKEQTRNKRNNIWVEYNGNQVLLRDLASTHNLPYKQLHRRFKIKKWTLEKSLQPIKPLIKEIEFNEETKSISEWEIKFGLNKGVLMKRLKRGWSLEKALTTNIKKTH